MSGFERGISWVSEWFDRVARAALALMMGLVVGNILLRAVWNPIPGTYEFVGYLGAVVIPFALAYCAVRGGHVAVTILMDRLPRRTQAIIDSITGIIIVGFFAAAAWRLGAYATDMSQSGEVSPTMELPYYPLVYVTGLCILLLGLVQLVKLLKSLALAVRK